MMLLGTVCIVFAYATAQTHGHFEYRNSQFIHAVYSSFMFMFLTSGLGLHNTFAVLQGLMGRKTAFIRTPKLNILADDHKVTTNRAYALKFLTFGFMLELLATALFLGLSLYSLWYGHFVLLSVYAYFAAGYVMVIYFTVDELLAARAQDRVQKMAKA